jgi:hypothetical protein
LVRFVVSKLWFVISKHPIPSDTAPWLHSVMIYARELVLSEIWEVTAPATQGDISAKKENVYLGTPIPTSPSDTIPDTNASGLSIRVD